MEAENLGPDGAYHSLLLGPPHIGAVQALFERSADYFRIATGAPPGPDEAQRAFVAGPPGKAVDDKRVIGVFDAQNELTGLLDALTEWPEPGVWMMGMLLIEPSHRGKGLGVDVLAAYHAWAADNGARECRTALVAHHDPGIRFLATAGYGRQSTLDGYDAGSRTATVLFFSKRVQKT